MKGESSWKRVFGFRSMREKAEFKTKSPSAVSSAACLKEDSSVSEDARSGGVKQSAQRGLEKGQLALMPPTLIGSSGLWRPVEI